MYYVHVYLYVKISHNELIDWFWQVEDLRQVVVHLVT